ncbi:hypothetical protein RMATCC62417_11530 [Rhizopus microsporus]|nr:hypothetical protein RMATCC62417_11530 [Rhizopus microsporus]
MLFVEWAISHNVPLTTFTETHLTNFLAEMFEARGYHHSIICLFRSAVTHLHQNPVSTRASEMVNALIKSLKAQASPKQIHRPTINLGSTLLELCRIDIDSPSTPIVHLQKKLAFLLGMAAFLHPSELHRIDFSTAAIKTESGRHFLFFQVIAPKEKRGGQRIVKPFQVYSHHVCELCPVATFKSLQHRLYLLVSPPRVSSFFVNTNDTTQMVTISTISTWLCRLLRFSSDEPRTNLRSLSSSAAPRAGVDINDIVTLGNWSSSAVFEQYYYREQLSLVDFINTVLPVPADDNVFHDAESSFD